ncbi:MFS transporter [Mucilaginibacter aquariorum]|uniref:MFS transporter n=1 Tax=Mucilaginibacter aquariorum TaxID=2967225 RepID=A0ABT1T186_9SPHI|nr:MFS transporter [Mucilaginibacter aquariorum]MCQ6958364.1 MFS transporter [Mucilaginibacter aquariorum]
MSKVIPIFRSWVPDWLIKVVLFIVLLPSLVLFFLPLSNINAAAGYYGCEPYDIQFAVVLFYVGYTSFFSLERRFFQYLATKEYFFIITFIQLLTSYICYVSQSLAFLFICRFLQGMAFTCTVNISLALIFSRLRTERAREVGYSIFFGLLICMIPFDNFITAELIDSFNFNTLYKAAIFSYAPSLVLLGIVMNNVRLNVKFPLYQLDWASFVLYAAFLGTIGYACVYGQEYYWLEDKRIVFSLSVGAGLLSLCLLRQWRLKRPYFELGAFRYRNFVLGAIVLFIFYICRFASGLTSTYFVTVLGLDPIHLSYINLYNISGIIVGVIFSCVLVLQHRPTRLILISGFLLLFIYHNWMFFLFNTQANESEFIIPLVIQGLGAGMLMTPTIVFAISAVPFRLGATAAGVCLFVRCLGFMVSIALINFFELFSKSKHYNTFQEQLSRINPVAGQTIMKHTKALLSKGIPAGQASKIADRLVVRSINTQGQIRFAMDYYQGISLLLFFTIILIALFPYINKTILNLRADQPAPF